MAMYNNYPMNYYGVPNFGQQNYQSNGFIPVQSETDARNYPVAPGNSVTFKDEKEPYVYVKTMGFSQLDRPVFEKYRLVREAPEPKISEDKLEANKMPDYASKSDIQALQDVSESYKDRLDALESDMEDLRAKIAGLFTKNRRTKNDEHNADD